MTLSVPLCTPAAPPPVFIHLPVHVFPSVMSTQTVMLMCYFSDETHGPCILKSNYLVAANEQLHGA